jgi:chromate transporter
MQSDEPNDRASDERHSPFEVLRVFLGLGLTSFGGPIAHLGYFERELVSRRRWITPAEYAEIVALCQVLPGPASSQVGMAIGKRRAGIAGSIAAWLAFTLPSALLLFLFALVVDRVGDISDAGWLHGLTIVAVAIVAQAVANMWRSLAPDRVRATFAIVAAIVLLLWMSALAQILVLVAGGIAGWFIFSRTMQGGESPAVALRQRIRFAIGSLVAFAALFALLPLLNLWSDNRLVSLADLFYRAGSIVFGGGHVVLPVLQAEMVPDFLTNDQFLAGYGAAQAVPGPLFTFASYLGGTTDGAAGALVATVAIFLPSFLLVWGVFPFWERIRHRTGLQGVLRGVNAAVVGILLAALYDPIWTTAVHDERDAAFALGLFGVLQFWKLPSWAVVAIAITVGAAFF